MKVTGKFKAWLSSGLMAESIQDMTCEKQMAEKLQGMLYTNTNMSENGWVEVGVAEIYFALHDKEKLHAKELEGLNKALHKVRAENQMRENLILDRISKLQAISYTPEDE